jgi:hypothetical protein
MCNGVTRAKRIDRKEKNKGKRRDAQQQDEKREKAGTSSKWSRLNELSAHKACGSHSIHPTHSIPMKHCF